MIADNDVALAAQIALSGALLNFILSVVDLPLQLVAAALAAKHRHPVHKGLVDPLAFVSVTIWVELFPVHMHLTGPFVTIFWNVAVRHLT